MKKSIKKTLLSSLSILGISTTIWIVLLLNPQLSYANETKIDNVSIFHNSELEEGTAEIVRNALSIIKTSDIYDKDIEIQLCLNDDKLYPNLHPFAGGTAYAFLDKTVIYASEADFENNQARFSWEINNFELRKFNLTVLLAHEFMHNVQNYDDPTRYVTSTLGKLNWKFEGHAEYIARGYKGDNKLSEKLLTYNQAMKNKHQGIPVLTLADGTILSLGYFKYALVIQYLMDIKGMNFTEVCALDVPLDILYSEMTDWNLEDK